MSASSHEVTATPDAQATSAPLATARLDLRAALEAGFIAGVAFLVLTLVASLFSPAAPFGPASITLAELMNYSAGEATTGQIVAALLLHFGLALATTLVIGFLVHGWVMRMAVVIGLAFGGILYTANSVIVGLAAPNSVNLSVGGLALIINYILYGIAAAVIYKRRQRS